MSVAVPELIVLDRKKVDEFRALLDAAPKAKALKEGGAHPFSYCMETIVPAMEEDGKAPDDPEAFCAWWKMEHASDARRGELQHLHVCGATGQVRTETLEGREYLVVPVVALMEGVIHAVNAETPEFVPLSTLRKAAATWNGRPVVLGHPTKDGRQCSANSPDVEASHRIGTIYNSRIEGKKLLQEAWIEKAKARKLDPAMYERLAANKTDEVSVGAFVVTDGRAGDWNGKRYMASWIDTTGDHLAFLPGGRGACSVEMGCGTHRAAMHFVTAEAFVLVDDLRAQFVAFIEECRAAASAEDIVERFLKKAKYEDCPACKGSGNVDGNPCEACDGKGELKTAAGARHSTKDQKMIQGVHDYAAALGAACDRSNFKMLQTLGKTLQPGDVVHNLCSSKGERVSLKVKSVAEHPTNPFLRRIAFEGDPKDSWVDRGNTYKVSRGAEEFTIRAAMESLVVFAGRH